MVERNDRLRTNICRSADASHKGGGAFEQTDVSNVDHKLCIEYQCL